MAEHHVAFPLSAKEAFPPDALERIGKTIEEVESATNAEIRLSIRDVRDTDEAGLSIKELAIKEFTQLGMHKTRSRTGVLLLIMFEERKFYIAGDEGIHRVADPGTWEDVAATIKEQFREGHFEEGVHQGLRKIREHVRVLIPKSGDDTDELSNEVILR
jgi:uncharacterized membrane protein